MTDFLALPPASRVGGSVAAPPSKSATNRALLLAALGDSPVELLHPLASDDIAVLRGALLAMGAEISETAAGLLVRGPLGVPGEEWVRLDAGDSGTAARFLAAAAAVSRGRFRLTGSPRLCERPMGELVRALRAAGARIDFEGKEGHLPLAIRGATLRAGTIEVDASRSSQFLSALLLVSAAVEGGLTVRPVGPVASAPYVRLTLETLREFGHQTEEGPSIRVRRGRISPRRYEAPGDYSSALPLLASAGAAGGTVTVTGLRSPSPEADALALPVLETMGIAIASGPGAVTARASRNRLAPVEVAGTEFPDAIPTLAALAALARGRSRFSGIGHLRWKESDRLAALASLLSRVGARADAVGEELTVEGPAVPPPGAVTLPTFRDHRMVMAASLLCLALPRLLIENPSAVAKSYPRFLQDLEGIVVR
jgi:3-phosphoshikimate 1-carboxyvinyltransferase